MLLADFLPLTSHGINEIQWKTSFTDYKLCGWTNHAYLTGALLTSPLFSVAVVNYWDVV